MHLLNKMWCLTCNVNINLCQKQRLCIAPTKRLLQKQLLKLMELYCNAILKILQHKFATPVSTFPIFIHIQGSWYLTVFSLRIKICYMILLSFSFLCFFTSLFPQSQNPRQSIVIVQGREEGVYFNKTQWSVACFHFFSTCVFKLPYQTMTLLSLYLPHSHSP